MSFRHLAFASISTTLLLAACTGDTIIRDEGTGGDDAGPSTSTGTSGDGDGDGGGEGDGGSPPTGPRQVSLDVWGWSGPADGSDVDVYVHAADGAEKAALLDGTFPTEVEAEPGDLVTFVFPGGRYVQSFRVTPAVEAIVGTDGTLPRPSCGPLAAPMRLRLDVPSIPGAAYVDVAVSNGMFSSLEEAGTIEIEVYEACPATLDILAAAVDDEGEVLGFEHVVVPVTSGAEPQIALAITDDATEVLSVSTSLPAGARASGFATWWAPAGVGIQHLAQSRVADPGVSTFVYEPEIIAPGFGAPTVQVGVGLVLEGTGSCDFASLWQTGSLSGPLSFDPMRLRWPQPSGDSWSTDGPGELGTRVLRRREYGTDYGPVLWNVFEDPGAPIALVLPAIPFEVPLGELAAEELRHLDDGRGDYATSVATGDAFESRSESRSAAPCSE